MSQAQKHRYRDGEGVTQWAERHDVHHELLPFDHRVIDPIETIRFLRVHFESWPKTKQTWTVEQTPLTANSIRSTGDDYISLPYFIGCYKIDTDRTARYTNPEYVHEIRHTPDVGISRLDHYLFYASLGSYSLADVGDIYNVNKRSVSSYLSDRGYCWRDLRSDGKRRFARTMETIHEWRDISWRDLEFLFGVDRVTLYDWRQRIVNPIPERPHFQR